MVRQAADCTVDTATVDTVADGQRPLAVERVGQSHEKRNVLHQLYPVPLVVDVPQRLVPLVLATGDLEDISGEAFDLDLRDRNLPNGVLEASRHLVPRHPTEQDHVG